MNTFEGKSITLRPIEIRDLEVVYQWENDAANWVHTNHLNPFSRFFLEQYILHSDNNIYTDKQLRLMIDKKGGQPIGIIDLFDFDPHHKRAAVGIMIDPDHQNKGYASDALQVVIGYARDILGLKQLYCGIGEGNEHSMKLFTREGFRVTGTRESWRLDGSSYKDEYFLQLIFA